MGREICDRTVFRNNVRVQATDHTERDVDHNNSRNPVEPYITMSSRTNAKQESSVLYNRHTENGTQCDEKTACMEQHYEVAMRWSKNLKNWSAKALSG